METREWDGEILFGESCAVYTGYAAHNTFHEHVCVQIVLCPHSSATVLNENNQAFTGSGILIRPLVVHKLLSDSDLICLYVDLESYAAKALLDAAQQEPIDVLSDEFMEQFELLGDADALLQSLEDISQHSKPKFDRRLSCTLDYLRDQQGDVNIQEAAEHCEISVSRLRTLARQQLGVPLATWLIWRKIEVASRELAKGVSLVEASIAGGFTDQSHLCREMRRMFGVTPGAASKALKPVQQ